MFSAKNINELKTRKMEFKQKDSKYYELVAMIENGSNVKLQDAFLDYQEEKNENNEKYLKHLDEMIKEAETSDKPALNIGGVTKRLFCFDYIGNCYVEDGQTGGDMLTEKIYAYDKDHAILLFKTRFVNVPFDPPY